MSERFIPAERATGYTPWDAVSFDAPKAKAAASVRLPTADEVAALQQRAHDEAYASGMAEVRAAAARVGQIGQSFEGAVAQLESDLADAVLGLAVDIARQVVRQSLAIRPELVLPVVRDALRGLAGNFQNNLLYLNPADAELVSQQMGDELTQQNWRVIGDERIEAGGCRVETSHGEVDATLATRWRQALSNLGRTDAWIE